MITKISAVSRKDTVEEKKDQKFEVKSFDKFYELNGEIEQKKIFIEFKNFVINSRIEEINSFMINSEENTESDLDSSTSTSDSTSDLNHEFFSRSIESMRASIEDNNKSLIVLEKDMANNVISLSGNIIFKILRTSMKNANVIRDQKEGIAKIGSIIELQINKIKSNSILSSELRFELSKLEEEMSRVNHFNTYFNRR